MKVVSNKCNIGLNGERYIKGTPFEVDEETGKRLLAQGTVELVGIPNPVEPSLSVESPKTPVETTAVTPEPEKPSGDEFEKVGGRWKKVMKKARGKK